MRTLNRSRLILVIVVLILAATAFLLVTWNQPRPAESLGGSSDVLPQNPAPLERTDSNPALGATKAAEVSILEDELSFSELQAKADRGSAVDQRWLSETYELCFAYSLNPTGFLADLEKTAVPNAASKARFEALKKKMVSRCNEASGGKPIPLDAYKLWLKQSAENGDLVAKVRAVQRNIIPAEQSDVDALVTDVLHSGDPAALLELSTMIPRADSESFEEPLASLVGNQDFEPAWALAACNAGAPC